MDEFLARVPTDLHARFREVDRRRPAQGGTRVRNRTALSLEELALGKAAKLAPFGGAISARELVEQRRLPYTTATVYDGHLELAPVVQALERLQLVLSANEHDFRPLALADIVGSIISIITDL